MIKNNNHTNLLLILFFIIFVGAFLMYSASSSFAFYKFNKSDTYFLYKHILWLSIGLIALFIISNINYNILNKYSLLILIVSWIIMLIPIILNKIGFEGYTIARWLKIGSFTIMTTSDFGKLAIIIFSCSFIDKYYSKINNYRFVLKNFFGYFIVSIGLILWQPDLSTSVLISLVIFCLFFISGIDKKFILGIIFTGLFLFICIVFLAQIVTFFGFEMESYKTARIWNWINSFGINGTQSQSYFSLLALSNGGFMGRGIGESIFKYNGFIPEGQTDFILAIIGEEIGFIGIFILFCLFTLFFIIGMNISKNCKNRFGMFLSLGISLNLFLYLLINSAYVIGILPTTGLPIPFISYGGSQTIFSLVSIAILINISKRNSKYFKKRFYYGKL